jgi:hypothetical protein
MPTALPLTLLVCMIFPTFIRKIIQPTTMKKIFPIVLLLFFSAAGVVAQSVSVDKKTGLVKVEGKDAFYLIAVNQVLWDKDFRLENLEHKELAYLKSVQGRSVTNPAPGSEGYYTVTFSATGNYCDISEFSGLNIMKSLARDIASARLIENGAISAEAERKFIVMHHGVFLKDPNARGVDVNVTVNNAPPAGAAPAAAPADISVKGDKIYNNGEMIGLFRKQDIDGKTMQVTVYGKDDNKVAEARHPLNDDNADWEVTLAADGKKVSLLYNVATPLEKLFKYLADKGYLK